MEFSDGTVQELNGNLAEEWLQKVNSALVSYQIRTACRLPKWEKIVKQDVS